jgi:hypothetical protein
VCVCVCVCVGGGGGGGEGNLARKGKWETSTHMTEIIVQHERQLRLKAM